MALSRTAVTLAVGSAEATMALGPTEVTLALDPTEITLALSPTHLSIQWEPGAHYQGMKGWEVKVLLLESRLCKATPPSYTSWHGVSTQVYHLFIPTLVFLKTGW